MPAFLLTFALSKFFGCLLVLSLMPPAPLGQKSVLLAHEVAVFHLVLRLVVHIVDDLVVDWLDLAYPRQPLSRCRCVPGLFASLWCFLHPSSRTVEAREI